MRTPMNKAWPKEIQVMPSVQEPDNHDTVLPKSVAVHEVHETGSHDAFADTVKHVQQSDVPAGTLFTLHVRGEHIFIVVSTVLCLILWSRLCSMSARLALLESPDASRMK
jgi:hypothetical protein